MDLRVQIYREITGFTPSLFQQDLIADRVTNADKWRKAVIWWMGNAYRPQSVIKVIEYYEQIETQSKASDVGRWDGIDHGEPDPPCPWCGKEICFSDHRDERNQEVIGRGMVQ